MAFTPHSVTDIEYLAAAMRVAADALDKLASQMKSSDLNPIYLQLSVAKTYADSFYKLAGEVEYQFRNQLHAKQTGGMPAYLLRQQKNALDKAKREAKADAESLGIVKWHDEKKVPAAAKKKTVKRSAKKKGTA